MMKKDPASTGAAATNKAIVLTLAQQIASIGGNPLDALKSGTFAPGTIGDPTAAGNTCDNIVDEGCINAGKEFCNSSGITFDHLIQTICSWTMPLQQR